MTDAETILVQHVFEAPPAAVYDAWLDRSFPLWRFAGPGEQVVRADLAPIPGGAFSIVVRHKGAIVEHVGQFLELDRPRRLVFTWGVAGQGEPVRVEVELTPQGSGTRLTLSHRIDPSWTWFLSRTEPEWMTAFEALDRQLAEPAV